MVDEYKYRLLDTHFKASEFGSGGRIIKGLFDALCREIFTANLTMLKDIEYFPLGYSEKNAYASIAHALHTITPYISSEESITLNDKKHRKSEYDEAEQKDKRRFVDFWCMNKSKSLEVWIEVKRLWLNIGKNANFDFNAVADKRIQNCLEQIDSIKAAKPIQVADTSLKMGLFSIPLSCKKSQAPDSKAIASAPKILADLLARYCDNKRKMGVLCASVELGEIEIYDDELTPYFALAGIILK